jgi:DNA invertase Pin-like site-specific DNA recombinase
MKNAIGYLRVSTREQGRSGLGLAAQRHDIESFGAKDGLTIKSCTRIFRQAPVGMRCCCARDLRPL